MLNFIICDDSKEFRDNLQKIIDSYMMKLDMDYKTYEYADYNKEFRNLVKSDIGFKIYFLDIRMGEASGIDAARMIREEFDDWSSIIIVVTSFSEYRYEALGNRLYLLDFVSKSDGCEKRIEENIKRALKNYNNTEKSITYELNHVIKRIEYRHILYIEKEQDSKRCIIKTIYGDQLIRKNLNDVEKMLDRTFMKVHRSLIVNLDLLKEFNVSENKLTFKNGESIYLVARKYKKELIDRVVTN